MSRTIVGYELTTYKPGEATPLVTIPGGNIQSVHLNERVQNTIGKGSISNSKQNGT